VIDHNTVNVVSGVVVVQYIGTINTAPPPSQIGTANNLFIEDNTITFASMSNASNVACTDGWGGAAYVVRHNTSVNCLWASHGVLHSGGPANYEFYNNNVSVNAGAVSAGVGNCYRCFHHQGSGEFIAFNNVFTNYPASGKASEVISMLHYRSSPPSASGASTPDPGQCDGTHVTAPWIDGNRPGQNGYPCFRQPGRDSAGNLMPMYAWNNYWSDTLAQVPFVVPDIGGSPDYFPVQMQANREWYNAVSASPQTSAAAPFNGSTGMGFGTLANRPSACTTNASESGGGVGYFATDVGAQGTLYRCSATNTWTVQYSPYTYPHPLVTGGSNGTPPPPTLAPPTAVSLVVH